MIPMDKPKQNGEKLCGNKSHEHLLRYQLVQGYATGMALSCSLVPDFTMALGSSKDHPYLYSLSGNMLTSCQ